MIIRAPSRLHMSLIDLNGSYKRIDGGIGLALSDPQFVLESEETNEKGFTLEGFKRRMFRKDSKCCRKNCKDL